MTELTVMESEAARQRRAVATAAIMAETGIDEALISEVVHRFYERVHADPRLGPIFAGKISDWEGHLSKMTAFWSSVALGTGRYSGTPMRVHLTLPIDADDFDQWLSLFEATVNDLCSPVAAKHFMERARRIAQSSGNGRCHAGRRHARAWPALSADDVALNSSECWNSGIKRA